jgi:hypothetical protein
VDTMNPLDTLIYAAADGTVVYAGDDLEQIWGLTTDFYGKLVVVELNQRYRGKPVYYLYGHVSEILAETGERVETGQVIAKVGMEGVAMGPHLHLEVRVGGLTYDHTRNPELWLKPFRGYGTIAGRVVTTDGCVVSNLLLRVERLNEGETRFSDVYTYLKGNFNSDDEYQENFVAADTPAGPYKLSFVIEGQLYEQTVEVEAGQTVFVQFVVDLNEQ